MPIYLIYRVVGLVACIVPIMVPIATWQRLGWMMLLGAFGLLVMVLLPGIGREVNGSMRWIGFSFFNVQPSEIAKVFVVIYLAGYLVRRQKIGRAHVCTPVTNAHLVCRLLLATKKKRH